MVCVLLPYISCKLSWVLPWAVGNINLSFWLKLIGGEIDMWIQNITICWNFWCFLLVDNCMPFGDASIPQRGNKSNNHVHSWNCHNSIVCIISPERIIKKKKKNEECQSKPNWTWKQYVIIVSVRENIVSSIFVPSWQRKSEREWEKSIQQQLCLERPKPILNMFETVDVCTYVCQRGVSVSVRWTI